MTPEEFSARASGLDEASGENDLARLLAALVTASREFIGVADLEGRALFVNEAGRKLVGLRDLEAVRSTRLIEYFATEDEPRVIGEVLPAVRNSGFWQGELTFRNFATGRLVPVLDNIFPIRNSSGEIIAYGTVTRNLTEARHAGEQLRSLLASIVETSDDAIVSKTLDGVITSWNSGAERVFGYPAREAVGQPITIVIPKDRQSEEREILTRVRRGERIDHYETVRHRKDGSLIVVSLTVSPVKDAGGKIVGASKIARDITEQKRTQEQIAALAREATAGQLSASIAHEVRQPLTAILANAEAALRWLEQANLEEVRETLNGIVSEGHRASDIVTNLRAMFKHDEQEKTLVDINKLVLSVLALVRIDLQKHEIELRTQFDDRNPKVVGNQVQLQQVILNLVMNAIEAMSSLQTRVLRIKTELIQSSKVHVSIEDTGTGIRPSDVDRIFKPMFTTKARGMGMGLSICQSMIENHDGRIWASPGATRGAIFQFELPTSADKD